MEFSKPLKLNHIFRRLYRNGNQAANRYLVLYCRPNHLKENRVGITVGKKAGKSRHTEPGAAACGRSTGFTKVSSCRDMTLWWLPAVRLWVHPLLSSPGPISLWRTSWGFGSRRHHETASSGAHPHVPKAHLPCVSPCCRFTPTCSQYAAEAISKYGASAGRPDGPVASAPVQPLLQRGSLRPCSLNLEE